MKVQPLRIAHIIGKMCAGGVESVAFNYYKYLDHDKIQFDFYYDADSTKEPPQELIDMGARFIKIPPYQRLWEYIPALISHFRHNHYQIVHSHMNSLSVFPLFTAWTAGVPVRIAHSHSVPGGSERARNLLKNSLKHFSKWFATDYFACSEQAGRWLFGDNLFDGGNVTIIRNAIDMKRFQKDDVIRKAAKAELSLGNAFVVGHVGRLTYAKNHSFLIDIFSEIKEREPGAVLLLIGDGDLREELTAYIAQKDLSSSVIMIGNVSDPEKYYQVFDVLVFPSHFEGFGMVVIEAQASGVPCVVSAAVPEEAIISNAVRIMDLTEGAHQWADTALKLAEKETSLTPRAEAYNIEHNAEKLQDKYLTMIEKY